MSDSASRAGRFVKQIQGFRAFIPAPLPPSPPVVMDENLVSLLSRADQAVGRLDGVTQILPNPDLFVAMFVRREAVLSSQIEGTQTTLDDVLAFELDPKVPGLPTDIGEVVNYVAAMNYGLQRLTTLPLSLRLIREIHAELLRDGRGSEKRPGEFRLTQNWIGAGNAPLTQAAYVPPPPEDMGRALDNLEGFLHDDRIPAIVHCGLAHAQFETIHPFLDGNGRTGRLLITFLLCHRGVLHRPLLYLSHYFKRYRAEYFDRLTAIREAGDWEGWLRFFVKGVGDTAVEATQTARAIVSLREQHRNLVQERGLGMNGGKLLDLLFQQPILNTTLVKDQLGISYWAANNLIERFEANGILVETTGHQRNRRFRYSAYLARFADDEPREIQAEPSITTGEAGSW